MSKQETIVEWKRIDGRLVRVERRRKAKKRSPKSATPQGIGAWGKACVVTACVAFVLSYVLVLKEADRQPTLAEFTQSVLEEHNRSQGIEQNEVAVEVASSASEEEYGYLAPLVQCQELTPDCWDRIAPKKGGK